MDLKKCKQCRNLFASNGESLCPNCIEDEETKFKLVKGYLWDYPGATINEIHQETEVEKKLIKKFVREGRFVEIRGVKLKIDCERCGAQIKSGRFCSDCRDKLKNNFDKAKRKKTSKEEKKSTANRMFTRDRHQKKNK